MPHSWIAICRWLCHRKGKCKECINSKTKNVGLSNIAITFLTRVWPSAEIYEALNARIHSFVLGLYPFSTLLAELSFDRYNELPPDTKPPPRPQEIASKIFLIDQLWKSSMIYFFLSSRDLNSRLVNSLETSEGGWNKDASFAIYSTLYNINEICRSKDITNNIQGPQVYQKRTKYQNERLGMIVIEKEITKNVVTYRQCLVRN